MAKAYSYDFRCKVIEAIELDGRKKQEVAELFNISRNTINLWLKRKAETGDLHEQPRNPRNPSTKLTDLDEFREFVRANGDKTQSQMADLWKDDISARTISRGLKKIGFTRKSGATLRRFPALRNAHQEKDLRLQRTRRRKATRLLNPFSVTNSRTDCLYG